MTRGSENLHNYFRGLVHSSKYGRKCQTKVKIALLNESFVIHVDQRDELLFKFQA